MPGAVWSPTAEPFRYDRLGMRTEVTVDPGGDPRRLVVDQLRLHPAEGQGLTGMGMLEGHSHTGQLLVADRRLDADLVAELTEVVDASDTVSGITRAGTGRAHGVDCVSVRSLAASTARIACLRRRLAMRLGQPRGQVGQHRHGQPQYPARRQQPDYRQVPEGNR